MRVECPNCGRIRVLTDWQLEGGYYCLGCRSFISKYLFKEAAMKIKTYPLQFTEEHLNEIKEKARDLHLSIKEFMLLAIEEKMNKED